MTVLAILDGGPLDGHHFHLDEPATTIHITDIMDAPDAVYLRSYWPTSDPNTWVYLPSSPDQRLPVRRLQARHLPCGQRSHDAACLRSAVEV